MQTATFSNTVLQNVGKGKTVSFTCFRMYINIFPIHINILIGKIKEKQKQNDLLDRLLVRMI